MMIEKYKYLHEFRLNDYADIRKSGKKVKIFFFPVSQHDLEKAQRLMGVPFPRPLIDFYSEVGCGVLASTIKDPYGGDNTTVNRFYDPLEIADMYLKRSHIFGGPKLKSDQLPVMELFSSNYLIVLKDEPGCPVCRRGTQERIEDTFEKFVHALAHQGPDYYLNRPDNKRGPNV